MEQDYARGNASRPSGDTTNLALPAYFSVGPWCRIVAYRLAALLILTCQVNLAQGQVNPTARGTDWTTTQSGVTIFRGQLLDYEVVDGMAVHGGDMIIGTAEDAAAAFEGRHRTKLASAAWPKRRNISYADADYLWPNGVIPYVIDSGFTPRAMQWIERAIDEWNSKTVIRLRERTDERDFVRFRIGGSRCSADLGRKGGEQSIYLIHANSCAGVSALIHEIGHTVGLQHEHQREDRDAFLAVPRAKMYSRSGSAYRIGYDSPAVGGYDYSSVMHYRNIPTFPPGIPINSTRLPNNPTARRSFTLSEGDIDGVARMYGRPPTVTTISTNRPE